MNLVQPLHLAEILLIKELSVSLTWRYETKYVFVSLSGTRGWGLAGIGTKCSLRAPQK